MDKIKNMLPYIIAIALSFYLLPFLIQDTGSGMTILLVVIPLICFICSVLYGLKYSFHLFYSVIVAILFVPSMFIFYNSSASIYILIYGLVALVGNAIGKIFYGRFR